jgi:hypothetical protein
VGIYRGGIIDKTLIRSCKRSVFFMVSVISFHFSQIEN